MISYRLFGTEYMNSVMQIYERAGWTAYLKDSKQLERAFDASLFVMGAFEDDHLVGFVRCVGDGEHIVYIQDLIVDAEWKRQGIGRKLIELVQGRFEHVRMVTLMTDAMDESANAFYHAIGMRECESNGLKNYFW